MVIRLICQKRRARRKPMLPPKMNMVQNYVFDQMLIKQKKFLPQKDMNLNG